MKIAFFILISLLLVSTENSNSFIGKWKIEGGSIIEIYKRGTLFFGKIHKRAENPISNSNGLDNNNPDPNLKKRQLVGMDILENLHFKNSELSGGTIYNADSGKYYEVKIWIDETNKNKCYIRAYKSILFKTFEAIRIAQ